MTIFYLRPMRQMGESAGGRRTGEVTWSMFFLRPMRQMGESAGR